MFRIQEGIDPGDPQTVVGRVIRTDKKKMVNSIIDYMVKNHHSVTEERYQFVEWLYRIRKQYPRMGLFQPDFICIIFGKMMMSKLTRTDADIHKAVNDWCEDPAKATAKYGHISKWNTSLVTNMKELFKDKREFNDNISKWNVSNVIDMSHMFDYNPYDEDEDGEFVSIFNGDISKWDVSNVKNMDSMFSNTRFNGDISGWNVSSVINMKGMFQWSHFNGDVSRWNVSNVKNMMYMFSHTPFNGDLSGWDVSSVNNMMDMFSGCPIPNEHKPLAR